MSCVTTKGSPVVLVQSDDDGNEMTPLEDIPIIASGDPVPQSVDIRTALTGLPGITSSVLFEALLQLSAMDIVMFEQTINGAGVDVMCHPAKVPKELRA